MRLSRFLLANITAALLITSICTSHNLAQASQTGSKTGSPAAPASTTETLNQFLTCLQNNKLHVVDLSHVINNKTPTWSGEGNEYQYTNLTSLDKHGYASGAFSIHEHFGTHMDAPAHFSPGAATVDKIPAAQLVLPAVVIDVRKEAAKNPDYELGLEKVKEWEKAGLVPEGAAVLLMTGWGQHYNSPKEYRNPDAKNVMHFPGYSVEAVKYLIDERHIGALGIDTLSIDPGQSEAFPVHNLFLKTGNYMVENLANLDQLPSRGILLFCGPLAIEGGSGCPSRVLAVATK